MLLSAVPLVVAAQPTRLEAIQKMVAEGQFQEALAELEPLIREEPDNPEARFLRGVVLAQTGEVERAISVFNSLTERFPELSEPYNNLAVLHASRGNYDEAREALTRAVELQPDYHTAHENLGDVYTKLAALSYQRAYHLRAGNERARRKYDTLSGLLAGNPSAAPAAAQAPKPSSPEDAGPPAAPPAAQASKPPSPADAAPPGPGAPPPRAGACLELGPVTDEQRAVVAQWLQEQGITPRPIERQKRVHAHYQVYLPGGGSRGSAQALMAELAARGITDMGYIGSGDLAGGVSLGLYRQEDSVARRKAQIREAGHEPQVKQRLRTRRQTWFTLPADSGLAPAAVTAVFPELKLDRGACR